MLYVICYMLYVICYMLYVLCYVMLCYVMLCYVMLCTYIYIQKYPQSISPMSSISAAPQAITRPFTPKMAAKAASVRWISTTPCSWSLTSSKSPGPVVVHTNQNVGRTRGRNKKNLKLKKKMEGIDVANLHTLVVLRSAQAVGFLARYHECMLYLQDVDHPNLRRVAAESLKCSVVWNTKNDMILMQALPQQS